MMERREKATDKQKKSVREVMKELFKASSASDDDDALMKSFMTYAESFKGKLEQLEIHCQNQPRYPGRQVIQSGKALVLKVLDIKFAAEFFQTVDSRRNDFFELAEDFEPVKAFFDGDQRGIFDKSLHLMRIYDDSKTFVVDAELEKTVGQIKGILKSRSPYRDIYKLPELNRQFTDRYDAILDSLLAPVKEVIDEARARVFQEMNAQDCKQTFEQRAIDRFTELDEKAERCNNVASLHNIRIEADTLKVRFLNEIADFAAKREAEKRSPVGPKPDDPSKGNGNSGSTQLQPGKKRKTVSIKSVLPSSTWQIQNEEDVDQCVSALREWLKGMLEENTIINVEF